ncbi:MAG: small subunit ribosomal protein [Thermodesulfobacteriota bacterium]|nr:small subunit ribosomal protein [Thermodesulfobacteriota bacterium]
MHPHGFRLGVNRTWDSRWYSQRDYGDFLIEDLKLREFLKKRLAQASISRIEIERAAGKIRVIIHTARPGVVIGPKGSEIEKLRREILKITQKDIIVDIKEIRKPEIDAQLVAENVAQQLERRIAFRRAMKKSVTSALKSGAKGIRIATAGRLGGAEMARREWYREGRVPLHTLRADIDYGFARATTTYGVIGIKVWIFKGEIVQVGAGEN